MSRTPSVRFTILVWISLAAMAVTSVVANAGRDTGASGSKTRVCVGAVRHPMTVHAMALDPPRRGELVRVRVRVASQVPMARGEVRMVATGGAALAGAPKMAFGRIASGGEAVTDFTVRLPAEGRRFLLQFLITGEGSGGLEHRGATLNLLPDGPAELGRVVVTDQGQPVVERPARRIDQ